MSLTMEVNKQRFKQLFYTTPKNTIRSSLSSIQKRLILLWKTLIAFRNERPDNIVDQFNGVLRNHQIYTKRLCAESLALLDRYERQPLTLSQLYPTIFTSVPKNVEQYFTSTRPDDNPFDLLSLVQSNLCSTCLEIGMSLCPIGYHRNSYHRSDWPLFDHFFDGPQWGRRNESDPPTCPLCLLIAEKCSVPAAGYYRLHALPDQMGFQVIQQTPDGLPWARVPGDHQFRLRIDSPASVEPFAFKTNLLTPLDLKIQNSDRRIRPIMMQWVENCTKLHSHCKQVAGDNPSRLLDLGSEGDAKDLKLHCPPTASFDLKYAALSHSWGATLKMKLTLANLEAFKTAMPLSSLPRTFRHAVKITRALGLRYLWIDALCIIQDSKDDWDIESARMNRIYSNCFVMLSALWGQNSESGMLTRASNAEFIPLPKLKSSTCKIGISSVEARHFDPKDCNLRSRAWTLQEEMLPTRVIYFARHRMYWSCSTISRTEYGAPMSAAIEQPYGARDQGQLHRIIGEVTLPDPRYRDHSPWWTIVSEYSSRSLTYQKDKLRAIEALARNYSSQFESQYIFGLWKSTIQKDLIWISTPKHKFSGAFPSIRDPVLQALAPSWSWASVNSSVETLIRADGCRVDGYAETYSNAYADDWGLFSSQHRPNEALRPNTIFDDRSVQYNINSEDRNLAPEPQGISLYHEYYGTHNPHDEQALKFNVVHNPPTTYLPKGIPQDWQLVLEGLTVECWYDSNSEKHWPGRLLEDDCAVKGHDIFKFGKIGKATSPIMGQQVYFDVMPSASRGYTLFFLGCFEMVFSSFDTQHTSIRFLIMEPVADHDGIYRRNGICTVASKDVQIYRDQMVGRRITLI